MKKLLIATDTYPPKKDGVVVFLKKIIPRLSPEFEITIIAPNFKNKKMKQIGRAKLIGLEVSDRIKLVSYPSIRFSGKNRKRIKEAVKEADVVWAQDPAAIGALSIIYGKRYKKTVISYVHQIPGEHFAAVLSWPKIFKKMAFGFGKFLTKYLYNKCSLVISPYKELAEILKDMGVYSKKVVIKLGVDSNEFRPAFDKFTAKKSIGIDPRCTVIGYCGRLSREKGLITLRRSYSALKNEHKNLCLLLIGGGPERRYFRKLKNAKVTGFVRNVVPYLQAVDIFVMPSTTETTSLATIEAMSCSIPVIATKVGYMKDYIIDKFNGLLFPPGNDYLLRKKIALLLKDALLRKKIGRNARETAIHQFNWNNTVDALNKALDMAG